MENYVNILLVNNKNQLIFIILNFLSYQVFVINNLMCKGFDNKIFFKILFVFSFSSISS